MKRGPLSYSKRWRGLMLAWGCSLSLACSVDNRPSRLVEMPGGNGDSSDLTAIDSAGSAGSSHDLPGGSVPMRSLQNTAGASGTISGDGTPNPTPPSSGGGGASGGGAAGSASMVMGSSSSGSDAGGGTGTGNISDPGETEVVGGCFNQLLANGGFERGHTAWSETSEAAHDVIVRRDAPLLMQAGVTPQGGDYLAWIGGIPNGDFRMYHSILLQTVPIPTDIVSLTLSGYYWVSQPEMNGTNVDWAVLEAEDPDPNVTALWVVKRFDDQTVNNSNGWVRFEETLLDGVSALAGKTLTVRSYSVPNGNGTLSLWLDSLRLEARCPR